MVEERRLSKSLDPVHSNVMQERKREKNGFGVDLNAVMYVISTKKR